MKGNATYPWAGFARLSLAVSIFTFLPILFFAQTVLINPSAEGGFELGDGSFGANGWSFDNGTAPNKWYTGTVPSGFNNRAAYISNNGGTDWAYNNGGISVVHFWRDITFPAGETNINLSCIWQAVGETVSNDALMVSLAPTSYTPVASTTSLGSAPLAAPAVTIGQFWNVNSVQTLTTSLPVSLIGNCSGPITLRVVFTWKNDSSLGANPPAAIDNISLTSAVANPTPALGTFTINNTLPTSGTNFNNFTAAINWLNGACINNPIVFNVQAGQTFNENPPVISATGTAANTITFQKSGMGANPVITPMGTTGTVDFGICISGGDYFTFDGIDINASAVVAVEYGYLIRNLSASDGASNNVIRNANIALNRTNSVSRAVFQTASTTGGGFVPTAQSGANSSNTYENLTIQNVYAGIYLFGNAAWYDMNNIIRNCQVGASAPLDDIGGSLTTQSFGLRASSQESVQIYGNFVRNIGVGTTVDGILVEVFRGNSVVNDNVIQDVRNTGTASTSVASGLRVTHSTTGTHNIRIYNNMISRITSAYTGAATATRVLRGINLAGTSGAATQTYDIVHNSVLIDGSASPNVSSSCFEIATISGPVFNIRNNIFSNQTGAQSGLAVHYCWRSTSATLVGNTGSVSNYNVLHVGNYTNGFTGQGNTTNFATLANWQAAMGQDGNSVPQNPHFLSDTDLHISTTQPTPVESGSVPVAFITDDIDGDTRNAVTPDIGADEGVFISLLNNDMAAQSFGTPIPNSAVVSGNNFSPNAIFENTGILAQNSVPVRFRILGPAPSNAVIYNEVATTGALAPGVSQAINFPVANIAATGFYTMIAAVELPGDQNNSNNEISAVFEVTNPLNGVYSIGAAQAAPFNNLPNAVNRLNQVGVSGPVTFLLTDASYPAVGNTITINPVIGGSPVNTLTIAPQTTSAITGNVAGCLIALAGADYVTIDGSNSGGTDRSLTIENTSTSTNSAVICVQSLGTGAGATDNTLKNLNILAGSNITISTFGIFSAGTIVSTTGTGDDNDNLVIRNNSIKRAYYGIYTRAAGATGQHDGLQILDNDIGAEIANDYVIFRGVQVQYANAPVISRNHIFNMKTTASATIAGIDLAAGVSNAQVTRNKLIGIQSTNASGWGCYGIFLSTTTGTPTNNLIANNFITDLIGSNYTSGINFHAYGIRLAGGVNTKVYHNSVNMFGDVVGGISASNSASLIITTSSVTGTEIRNNIFRNVQSFAVATSNIYNIYLASGVTLAASDNNTFFGTNSANTNYHIGFNGANRTTLADWQTATGQDANSVFVAPVFVSDTDLHMVTTANQAIDGAAVPLAGLTVDIDGDLRNATTPDIGADEFTYHCDLPENQVNIAIEADPGNAVFCGNGSVGLTASGADTYLWNTEETTATIAVSPGETTTYSVVGINTETGCSGSAEITVIVAAPPVPVITPGEITVCPGESTILQSSPALSYLWSNGETTQSITVAPNVTEVFSVTVTDGNGCTGTASATVNVDCPPPVNFEEIVAAEYFVDTDPGVGNGTPISINTPADEVSGSFTLNVTGLLPGFHNLYVRGRDAAGQWGFTHRQSFYVASPPVTPPAVDEEIVEAEYFVDTDPGVGNGTDISITPGETVNGSFVLDVTGLLPGFHNLYVRGRNAAGQWGFTHRQRFYVASPPVTPVVDEEIVAAEYFIDTDPGVGNGIPVPIPSPGDVVVGTNVPIVITQCLDPGTHRLYLRGKNAEGEWGFYASTTITIEDLDVEITAAQHQPTSNCGITESETLLVTLTNTGANEIPAGTIPVEVSVSGANTGPYGPFTHTAPIPPNGQVVVAVTGIDLSNPGLNTLLAEVDVCNDGPQGNSFSVDVTGVAGPVPSVNQPANQADCAGESTNPVVFAGNTPGATYEWTNDNPVIGLAASGTGDIPAFMLQNPGNTPLTATITVTPFFDGCNGVPKNFTITASAGPEAAISGDFGICDGQTTILTASGGGTYAWSTNEQTASITVNTPGDYTVTVTDEAGCSDVATATVLDVSPNIQITGIPEICAGETATLTATGGVSYLWNTGAETASITVGTPGVYSVTGTDAEGCTNTASVDVTEVSTVTVIISGDLSICSGETTILTATAGASYLWSTGAETQSIEVSAAGTYSVSVTSVNGCTGENSVSVVVNDLPTAAISGDLSVCEGETGELTASGGTAYLWSTGAEISSINISPLAETTYAVTVTDANGCSASASQTVSVLALPSVVISGDLEFCEGESSILTASGGTSYLWSTGATDPSIEVTTGGQYSVTATGANGCEAESSVTVTVNPAPALTILGDLSICTGETTSLVASIPSGSSPLIWTKANPATLADYGVNGGLQLVSFTGWNNGAEAPAVNGDFELEYQIEVIATGGGIGDVMFGYAKIDPNPANILGLGPNGRLLYLDQGSVLYDYNAPWTNSPAPLSAVAGNIITFTLSRTGGAITYTIEGGTPALKTGTVEASNSDPVYPVAVFYNNGCRLLSATLNGAPVTYLWSTGATTASIDVSPLVTTPYSVEVTEPGGCSSEATVTVTVTEPGPPTASCQDITVNLVEPGTYTLSAEELNDNSTPTCSSSPLQFSIPPTTFDCEDVGSTFEITLTVSDGVFSSTCTAQVTVSDTDPVCNQPPSAVCQSLTVNADANCEGIALAAAFDDGSTDPENGMLTFSVSPEGPYPLGLTNVTLTVTDDEGASDDCATTILVQDLTPPAISCPASTTVSPSGGSCEYTISGTGFDPISLSDNCGSVTATNDFNGGATLNGATLEGGEHLITWTATDGNNQTASCQFVVTVECEIFSGTLFRRTYGDPVGPYPGVAQATVLLTGSASDTDGPTPASGEYSLFASASGNFTIKPEKKINLLNGLDAGDATAIQQHVAGTYPGGGYATDFFQLVAADVNKSNTITTLDATIIRQATLGNQSAINIIKNTGSWRFIPTNYGYPDPAGPISLPVFPQTRTATESATGLDFYGVKTGDFLQTANPLLLPQVLAPVVWRTSDRRLVQGETVEVDFTVSNFSDIAAYQFAFGFDPEKLVYEGAEVLTGLIPLDAEGDFGLLDGQLRTSFSMAEGYDLPEGEPVFRLRFGVLESGHKLSEALSLSPEALAPRAYSSLLLMTDVELEFSQDLINSVAEPGDAPQVQLLQNRPNPFERETAIGFILTEACEAQLRVYDVNGHELLKTSKRYPAGYSEERLETDAAAGVLFYELTTPFGVLVRKMIVIGD